MDRRRSLVWTYRDWLSRRPSFGCDEWSRHTLVVPWPFGGRDVGDEDGWLAHRAVCVVVRPWWLCRFALDPTYRTWVRWDRGMTDALYTLPEDYSQEAFDEAYDAYVNAHGPQPAMFGREDR